MRHRSVGLVAITQRLGVGNRRSFCGNWPNDSNSGIEIYQKLRRLGVQCMGLFYFP
jgi:hypothetical protein